MQTTADRGSHVYRVNEDVVLNDTEGGLVAVNLATDSVVRLNETAGRLLALLAEGRSEVEAEEALAAEYDVDRGELRADVRRTVAALVAAGVLQPLAPA